MVITMTLLQTCYTLLFLLHSVVANAPPSFANDPRTAFLSVRRLGLASVAPSTLRNIAGWDLDQLGASLAISEYVTSTARFNWHPNQALPAVTIERVKATVPKPKTGADYNNTEYKRRYAEILDRYEPLFKQSEGTATRLCNRFRSLLGAMKGNFEVTSKVKVKSDFLLTLFDAQRYFLQGHKNFRAYDDIFSSQADVKQAYRAFNAEKVRLAIKYHKSQLRADEKARETDRSPLYLAYENNQDFGFTNLNQLNICDILPKRCRQETPSSAAPPPATGGKKKRSTDGQCFHKFCLQNSVWKHNPAMSHTDYKYRTKRFAGITAVISLISSIASAAYTANEISSMRKAIANSDKAITEVVETISIARDDIEEINEKVDQLCDATFESLNLISESFITREIQAYQMNVQAVLLDLDEMVTAAEAAFGNLRQNIFPHSIVQMDEMISMFDQLTTKAAQNEQRLMFSDYTGLFQAQCDLVLADGRLYIIQHIPIISTNVNEPKFYMWTLNNAPILIGNVTFTFSQPKPYIVMDSQATQYKSLSEWEFQQCKTYNLDGESHWHCPKTFSIYRRDTSRNCLVKLYLQDYTDLHETCNVKIGHLSDFVSQVTRHTFLIYSTIADSIYKNCPNKATKVIPYEGFYNLTLEDGCDAETHSHHVYTGMDEIWHHSLVLEYKRIDLTTFFAGIHDFNSAINIIADHLNQIKQTQPKGIHLSKARALVQQAIEENSSGYWFFSNKYIILFVLAGITTVAAIVTLSYVGYRFWLTYRLRRALDVPHEEHAILRRGHNDNRIVEIRNDDERMVQQPMLRRQILHQPPNLAPII